MRRAIGPTALAVGLLAPVLPLLVWAVSGQWRYPALVPERLTGRGVGLIADPDVVEALATSLVIATAVAVLAAVLGLGAGRAVGLYSFPGRRVVQFLLFAPALVPTIAVALGIQVFLIRYGLADTIAGVVLVQLIPTVPYVSLVLGAAFANLDPDVEDQARMLGAGPIRRAVLVTLPAVRPALVVSAFLAFLISWSEYILTLLVGGGTVRTLPLLLFATIGTADYTAAAALALVIAVPPLVLISVTSRFLTGATPATIGFGRL